MSQDSATPIPTRPPVDCLTASAIDIPIGRSRWQPLWFWLSVLACFAVACSGLDRYTAGIERTLPVALPHLPDGLRKDLEKLGPEALVALVHRQVTVPIRTALFFVGMLFLLALVIPSLRAAGLGVVLFHRANIQRVTFVVAATLALVFLPRLRAMGVMYGEITVDPFAQETGWIYRRLLTPGLAYFLQLKGYLLYNVFHWILTWLLVAVALAYVEIKSGPLRWWQAVSLATVNPIVHQFQTGGYVEVLVFLAALAALMTPADKWVRGALLALALATHETAAVVVFLPLVIGVFPRRELPLHLAIMAAYVFCHLANFGFDAIAAIQAQTRFGSKNSLDDLLAHPADAVLGIVFAYKALWLAVAAAVGILLARRQFWQAAVVGVIVLLPIAQLPLGVDTSRLAGFGGIAVLWSVAYLRTMWPPFVWKGLLAANLLVPSYAIALGGGLFLAPGLYHLAVKVLSGAP